MGILETCNDRLCSFSSELPGLFLHHGADEVSFRNSSTIVLRQLADNVLKPSEELGLPFVTMVENLAASGRKTMKFTSGNVTYDTKDEGIHNVAKSIQTI